MEREENTLYLKQFLPCQDQIQFQHKLCFWTERGVGKQYLKLYLGGFKVFEVGKKGVWKIEIVSMIKSM
jgi:hypothetical protein